MEGNESIVGHSVRLFAIKDTYRAITASMTSPHSQNLPTHSLNSELLDRQSIPGTLEENDRRDVTYQPRIVPSVDRTEATSPVRL